MYCPTCQADYPADWKSCPKDSTVLLTSAHIGKYAIEGVVGTGGMGAVYRARNPDTGGAVAVKVMNREVAAAADMRERFKREAGVVARLDTAHVCKVHDFGSAADGTMFLVMELMKGHTLREEIVAGPDYMDLARVQMVMNGALKGLSAAHAEGIVHRDLKPDNIFVADTFDGEVPKLLDFGIARVSAAADANLTRTGTMMGTASYMAPEQVTGATSQMGPWTDVYAMGAILYEMLAGAPAFGGSTLSEVLHHVLHGDAVALSTLRLGLPTGVYALVDRCLSIEPAKRPQDADAMRRELLAAALVGAATPVPPPSKTSVDPAKPELAVTLGVDDVAPPPIVASKPREPVTPSPPAVGPVSVAPPSVEPKPRSMFPLVGLGVVVLAAGGVFAVTRGGGNPKEARIAIADGQVAVTAVAVDASAPASVAVAPVADPDVRPPVAADLATYTADLKGTGKLGATIETNLGAIHCELFGDQVPITVANFIGLATGKKPWKNRRTGATERRPFYDNSYYPFARGESVSGILIASLDTHFPGYDFEPEHVQAMKMEPGSLAMVNRLPDGNAVGTHTGPGRNGSEFFISQSATAGIVGTTIFGRCDWAKTITVAAAGTAVTIQHVEITRGDTAISGVVATPPKPSAPRDLGPGPFFCIPGDSCFQTAEDCQSSYPPKIAAQCAGVGIAYCTARSGDFDTEMMAQCYMSKALCEKVSDPKSDRRCRQMSEFRRSKNIE